MRYKLFEERTFLEFDGRWLASLAIGIILSFIKLRYALPFLIIALTLGSLNLVHITLEKVIAFFTSTKYLKPKETIKLVISYLPDLGELILRGLVLCIITEAIVLIIKKEVFL